MQPATPEKPIKPRLPYQDDPELQEEQPDFVARFLAENESCTACSLSVFDQLASAISQRQCDTLLSNEGGQKPVPAQKEIKKKP